MRGWLPKTADLQTQEPRERRGNGSRIDLPLLAVCAAAGVAGILKGLGPDVADGIEFYWLLTYEHGFIRRALIGTLFRPLLTHSTYEQQKPVIFALHVVACLVIVALCIALFRRAMAHEASPVHRVTLGVACLVLLCSPLLPTLGHDVGYVDVYLIVLGLAAVWLTAGAHYAAAVLPLVVAPLIHESFVFVWAPAAILLTWSCVETRRDTWKKILVAAAPMLSTAAVVFFQSQTAAAQAIDALPVSAAVRDGLRTYELEQTIASSFAMMQRQQFPGNGVRIATSLVYLLAPAAAIVAAAVFCHWRVWRARWATLLVVVAATLSPSTAILFAWDLSRFVVWSNLAAGIAIAASGTLLAGRVVRP